MTPYTNFQFGHWIAIDDDYYYWLGDPMGVGRTEAEAVEDLKEQMEERDRDSS